MIPTFPRFKKLELKDKKEIENFTKQFPPYSDYNFTSMWCYNTEDKMRVSWLNGNLVVRFQDYIKRKLFYSFLGTKKVLETADILLKYSQKKHLKPLLKLIPEVVIEADKKLAKLYKVKEDRDHFDYIYSLKEISSLCGVKFSKKRYWANKFIKLFPYANYQCINNRDTFDKKLKNCLFRTFFAWEKIKNRQRPDTIHEFKAIKRLLDKISFFNSLFIVIIQINNKAVAFSITEMLSERFAISHFMKADTSYKGILESLLKFTSKQLLQKGYIYLNREQDLGLITLRQAKKQWKPNYFLKKNTINSLC